MDINYLKDPLNVNHVDISYSSFQNATIKYSSFIDVDLSNLSIKNASLKDSSIINADIEGMKIDYVSVKEALRIYADYWKEDYKKSRRQQHFMGRLKTRIINYLNTY